LRIAPADRAHEADPEFPFGAQLADAVNLALNGFP
jgi:hypothetical protein